METLEPIAVVGLACRFPGAAGLDEFWANLVAGRESITFWDEAHSRAAGVPDRLLAHPDYVPAKPVLPDADRFDAALFGMTAREAQLCDPQLRVFLEICHAALEHAGYDPFAMPDAVGVFGGTGPNGYLDHCLRRRPDLVGPAGMLVQTLNQPDYLSTLVAYKLDLRGPAMTVLTACSSALVTIHLACQALRLGECDAAVAGASVVDVPDGHGHLWTPGNVLSRDGHCRPFDAGASGTVFGGGAGAVVLKRLDDAIADHDNVRAVILGSAVNNDGAQKVSFSAPSVSGQAAVVMEAMALAGVEPDEVGYVEAHATGTALGDPVEVAALAEAYRGLAVGGEPGTCVLGSVKSNIGHAAAAAGIAGFIKAVLAIERGAIPPTVHLTRPNPLLELAGTPFALATELRSWPRADGRRRVAGVTSLGIGGTNAHAVLTEAPPVRTEAPDDRPRVVLWSAAGKAGVDRLRTGLAEYLAAEGESRFPDAVATLQHGRTAHRYRAATVASSAAAAVAALRAAAGAAGVTSGPAADEPAVAYLFPGQGTGGGTARGLYGTVRAFTVPMDECLDAFEQLGVPLYGHWLDARGAATESAADPAGQVLTQSLLFAVEYALAGMWREFGVPPVAVLGHSLGELSAAASAGVFTLADAAALVLARAEAMARYPVPGGMLAVSAAEPEVLPLLPGDTAVAAVNAARQVVVCGPDEALADLADRLARVRIASTRIPVAAAFHHPGWQDAADAWAKAFAQVRVAAPRVPLYSGRTGGPVGVDDLALPEFWTGQLVTPVRFHDALTALLAAHRPGTLLETGPGGTLSGLARRHDAIAGTARVAGLRGRGNDHADVLDAAARLWVGGARIDWSAAGQPGPRVRLAVPGYPYERIRYWADPPAESARPDASPASDTSPSADGVAVDAAEVAAVTVEAPVVGVPVVEVPAPPRVEPAPRVAAGGADGPAVVTALRWVEQPEPAFAPTPDGPRRALVMLPDDPGAARTVLSAVQRAGWRPVRLRHGAAYAERAGEYTVRPGEAADLHRVLDREYGSGAPPEIVVHAAGYGPVEPATPDRWLATGFFSLLVLCQVVLGSSRWPTLPAMVLLTSAAVDVSGGEPVEPARAMLPALLRAAQAESPGLRTTVLDLGGRVDAATLARELAGGGTAPLALRGRRRWRSVETPLPVPANGPDPVRERGVYLITGGTGGLGLEVAKGLAGTGLCPTIVLASRTGPAGAATDAEEEIRRRGAELVRMACDVTDEAAVRHLLTEVTARYGPVNGLLHLAGVPGGRMVALRDPADAAAVLAPKVHGTWVLERALADRPPLDFAVYFSSRAAVEGLVGNADYGAANAYLDGAASVSTLAGGRVLSVGWPVWRDVGMAVGAGVDINRLNDTLHRLDAPGAFSSPSRSADPGTVWERRMSAADDWVLDEHRVGAVPLLPGAALLDLALRAFRETVGGGDERPVELADAVLRAPFFDRAARLLQVVLRPAAGGHAVLIRSRPDAGGDWLTHLTAEVRTVTAEHREVDLAGLRRRFVAAGTPQPPQGEKPVFTLGPRWRNFVSRTALGTERLMEVRLPDAYADDLADHELHPALLDNVTAAVRGPGQASAVPFLYQRMTVFAPLPERFLAHVRTAAGTPADTASGDLDLIADDGRVLVAIEGFTMRVVDERRLRDPAALDAALREAARADAGPPGAAGADVGPPGAEGLAAVPPGAAGVDAGPVGATGAYGLAPAAGVDLLLGMLRAGISGPVLVRPFVDGKPVPLDAARAAAPPPYAAAPPTPASPTPASPTPASPAAASPAPASPAPASPAQFPPAQFPPAPAGPVPALPGSGAPVPAPPTPAPPAPDGGPVGPVPPVPPGSPGRGPAVAPAAAPLVGPADPDRVLRDLWAQTLGVTDIDADQDFFDAGGNSLSAVELMARVREAFGIELRIGLLLEARTFSELAATVQARLAAASPE